MSTKLAAGIVSNHAETKSANIDASRAKLLSESDGRTPTNKKQSELIPIKIRKIATDVGQIAQNSYRMRVSYIENRILSTAIRISKKKRESNIDKNIYPQKGPNRNALNSAIIESSRSAK